MVKYFFRLDYASAVQSVPVCAVHWIHFNVVKDSMNCVIGEIPMQSWHELIPHPTLKSKTFISLNDLQPSRFALSYVTNPNRRAYWMEVAFIALDSTSFLTTKKIKKPSQCLKNKTIVTTKKKT